MPGVVSHGPRQVVRGNPTRPPSRRAVVSRAPTILGLKWYGAVVFESTTGASFDGTLEIQAALTLTSRTEFGAATSITGSEWKAVVVDVNGGKIAELPNATIGGFVESLNEIGEARFSLGTEDPAAASVVPLETEVQIWKGDSLRFWGVVTREQANPKTTTFIVSDLFWYFTKRTFGDANRTNLFENPSFEDGVRAWHTWRLGSVGGIPAIGTPGSETATTTKDRVLARDGEHFLTFTNTQYGTTVGGVVQSTDVAVQGAEVTAGDRPLIVTLSAWFRISDWDGPGDHSFGLGIARYPANYPDSSAYDDWRLGAYVEFEDAAFETIDETSPRNKWELQTVQIEVEANTTRTIFCRLSGIQGTIHWDRVRIMVDEALEYERADYQEIVEGIVDHAQDPAWGKDDLNIGTSAMLAGAVDDFIAYYSEHEVVWDRLRGLTEPEDGIDLEMKITPTTRNVRVHHPHRGRFGRTIAWGRDFDGFVWSFDGEAAGNQVIVLGPGIDAAREEALVEDLSVFGGRVFEFVHLLDDGVNIDDMVRMGGEELRYTRNPSTLEIVHVPRQPDAGPSTESTDVVPSIYGLVNVGDRVAVKIAVGWLEVDDDYRVLQISTAIGSGGEIVNYGLARWAEARP